MPSLRTSALSGPLIVFIDATLLLGQAQFLIATEARLRQPAIVELPVAGSGPSKDAQVALVTVIVAADGTLRIDADRQPLSMAELGQRLAPLRDREGTAFLHGDPEATWGTMVAVQHMMSQALARDIVAPLLP